MDQIVIEILSDIYKNNKIAFCFNPDSLKLLVSTSGHATMLRYREKRDYDFGGWCDLATGRIWNTSGTLSNVPEKCQGPIRDALEDHFHIILQWRL